MDHLKIDRMIAASGGEATTAEREHLAACTSCREETTLWRRRLEDLQEAEANAVTDGELHKLRVLYRHLGPAPVGRSWIASLVRSSEPAVAAVRGGATASLQAYSAGPWEIIVQIRPTAVAGRFDLQGQVVGEQNRAPAASEVVLLSGEGYVDRTAADGFGEFRFCDVPAGPYRALWLMEDGRIEVESILVGDENEGAEH